MARPPKMIRVTASERDDLRTVARHAHSSLTLLLREFYTVRLALALKRGVEPGWRDYSESADVDSEDRESRLSIKASAREIVHVRIEELERTERFYANALATIGRDWQHGDWFKHWSSPGRALLWGEKVKRLTSFFRDVKSFILDGDYSSPPTDAVGDVVAAFSKDPQHGDHCAYVTDTNLARLMDVTPATLARELVADDENVSEKTVKRRAGRPVRRLRVTD